jgi:cytochrome c
MNLRAPMNPRLRLIATTALLAVTAFAGQKPPNKGGAPPQLPGGLAAVTRGRALFQDKCEICHFSNSQAQKLGPGLKGIYTRGKFADGKPVSDALMEKRISDGSANMPAYSKILKPGQIHDLVLYVRTL